MDERLYQQYVEAKEFLYGLISRSIERKSQRANEEGGEKEIHTFISGGERYDIRMGKRYKLEGLRKLCDFLEIDFTQQKYIHVAGTSGKGSVTTGIHTLLYEHGYHVASYVSPHVVTPLERYRIDGGLCAVEDFLWGIQRLKEGLVYMENQGQYLYYYQAMFLLALLLFQRSKVEVVVVEAAMGGLFDFTNIIPGEVAVITNVSWDHVEALGPGLREIAFNKAGIIKKGAKVVTGVEEEDLYNVIATYAEEQGAELYTGKKDCVRHAETFQKKNVCLIEGVKDVLIAGGYKLDSQVKHAGHISLLPGRLELMQTAPLVILDGAHNEAKMKGLVAELQRRKRASNGKLIAIFGAIQGKNIEVMIETLCSIVDKVICTEGTLLVGKSFIDPREIARMVKEYNKEVVMTSNPQEAVIASLQQADSQDTIVGTGSMYLIGELRAYWESERSFLEKRLTI